MAYESDIINIAVVNFKVASGEKEVNLRRMMDMSRAAARRGADLILFPEMALMGYGMFIDESISQEEKIRVTETVKMTYIAPTPIQQIISAFGIFFFGSIASSPSAAIPSNPRYARQTIAAPEAMPFTPPILANSSEL